MLNLERLYSSQCSKLGLLSNNYVTRVLKETCEVNGDFSLGLAGNSRIKEAVRLSDDDVLVLSKTIRSGFNLKALDLGYNRISDDGTAHLAELLQDCASLQVLDLTCNDIEARGAERIAQSLRHNTSLKKLRMCGNKMGNTGAMHFASMLQTNAALQELDMSQCDLGTQSLIAFAIVLHNNKSLASIDLTRPLLFSLQIVIGQEEPTVHVAQMLLVNRTLKELHLGKHGMTDGGVERLCEALTANRSLRYLDLRCNRITRDGARCLAGVLRGNDTLEILDLSSNRIEDDGAVCLSDALQLPGCRLTTLVVTSNNIAAPGLVSLAKAVNANPHLMNIYIWGNRLEEPVCVAFCKLIADGRLLKEHTDVVPYEVDGRLYLAEFSHGTRRRHSHTPSDTERPDTPPDC